MASKNSNDAAQRSKALKKGLEHQNYRRQMEAEELKQEILLRLEKDAKKEEKRLAKIAKDRQEVEHLKQESLIEQVPIILSEKKKSKHGKTEVQNGQASAEPKVDGHISVENNDIARSGYGDKHDDDGMWDDGIWDESWSNVPSASLPSEIWDETSVTKQTDQMSRFNQGDTHHQSQRYKSERTFYSSNNNNGCKSKDRTGSNEFKRDGRNNSYKDNRRNNSKRKEDRQFQKRNSSARYSERQSRSNSESAWDEPKQSFRPTSGQVDAPLPEVNVWAQRQCKMEELEQMKPHNDYEEEAMLHQALELSRRQAIEDEKRRNELHEEYCTQLKYLSKNPDLAAELEAIEESGAAAATPSTYSKNDNYGWDDDKSQHESDDGVMRHNSRKAQHSYNKRNYNLECSYEMPDVCGTDENNQKQHEYKGARPKYKQTVISQESWNAPATTYENNVQYDDDGIWGDVDGPSDNGKCSEDVIEAKEDHSEVEEETTETEQELNTVCNRVLDLSLVTNKANSQIGYEEKHKSESLCNSSSNESVCDDNGGDSSGSLNIHAKIVQNKDKEHKISSFQDYTSGNTPFDNKLNYISGKTFNNEESKRNTYLVKETSFFEDKHDSKNSNFVKDKEQDLWNDELNHLVNSVKGVPLSSELKFNTVPFNGLDGDLNFRKTKGESNLPTELIQPAVSKMTIKAVSALQKDNSKNTMSSVEEWLASTQKETPLANPYVIDEHALKPKDIESSLYNTILNNRSDASDHHTDDTRSLRPPGPEEKNNCLSAATLFPQSPLEYSMSAVPNTVPNCIPENISESLRQIPASSFGTPLASAPYSPFFSPGIQPPPLPVNSAATTSSLLWQQAVMCANPLIMQQLHALQMFYLSLGVPAPNTFVPAPPVLPSQQTFLPQNPYEGINFPLQQHSNNFNSLNFPSSAQYQAPLLPQFIPNSADANKTINAPIQSLLNSPSISMDKPQEATPLPPPGINVDYFGPQSEGMTSFMKLPDEFINSHAAHNLVSDDGFVGIPPPKPAEKTTGSETIRRPRYKFNDLRPLLQQSNSNQSAQNYTVPKGNEERF